MHPFGVNKINVYLFNVKVTAFVHSESAEFTSKHSTNLLYDSADFSRAAPFLIIDKSESEAMKNRSSVDSMDFNLV